MDVSETMAFVAGRIKELCDKSGMSIRKLALRSSLSTSTLYALMGRKYGDSRVETLRKICTAFSISLSSFWANQKDGNDDKEE